MKHLIVIIVMIAIMLMSIAPVVHAIDIYDACDNGTLWECVFAIASSLVWNCIQTWDDAYDNCVGP